MSGSVSPALPEKKERNIELENILGNMLVAKYQVFRLEEKLAWIARTENDSTFIFRDSNGEWYKVSVNVTKQEDKKEEEELDKAFETSP